MIIVTLSLPFNITYVTFLQNVISPQCFSPFFRRFILHLLLNIYSSLMSSASYWLSKFFRLHCDFLFHHHHNYIFVLPFSSSLSRVPHFLLQCPLYNAFVSFLLTLSMSSAMFVVFFHFISSSVFSSVYLLVHRACCLRIITTTITIIVVNRCNHIFHFSFAFFIFSPDIRCVFCFVMPHYLHHHNYRFPFFSCIFSCSALTTPLLSCHNLSLHPVLSFSVIFLMIV